MSNAKSKFGSIALASALILGGMSPALMAQTAGQDMRNAGHETKNATEDAGHGIASGTRKGWHATKHGTEHAYHKTKRGTKHIVHKSAAATERGADRVEDKTAH